MMVCLSVRYVLPFGGYMMARLSVVCPFIHEAWLFPAQSELCSGSFILVPRRSLRESVRAVDVKVLYLGAQPVRRHFTVLRH